MISKVIIIIVTMGMTWQSVLSYPHNHNDSNHPHNHNDSNEMTTYSMHFSLSTFEGWRIFARPLIKLIFMIFMRITVIIIVVVIKISMVITSRPLLIRNVLLEHAKLEKALLLGGHHKVVGLLLVVDDVLQVRPRLRCHILHAMLIMSIMMMMMTMTTMMMMMVMIEVNLEEVLIILTAKTSDLFNKILLMSPEINYLLKQ